VPYEIDILVQKYTDILENSILNENLSSCENRDSLCIKIILRKKDYVCS